MLKHTKKTRLGQSSPHELIYNKVYVKVYDRYMIGICSSNIYLTLNPFVQRFSRWYRYMLDLFTNTWLLFTIKKGFLYEKPIVCRKENLYSYFVTVETRSSLNILRPISLASVFTREEVKSGVLKEYNERR